jgi:hypothetical protein
MTSAYTFYMVCRGVGSRTCILTKKLRTEVHTCLPWSVVYTPEMTPQHRHIIQGSV